MKTAFDRVSANGRYHTLNHVPALLMSAEAREQRAMLTADDMAYATFAYNPRFPALEQAEREAAWTPEFPAITGRIAYCNGKYVHDTDTSVTYRRGRKMVTEWHALARVGQH